MTSYTRVLTCALLLAASSVVPTTSAFAAPAVGSEDPAPSSSPEADPLSAQIADATGQLQTDLTEMRAQQTAAEDRYAEARAKARQLQKVVARNQAAADQARLVVGQYARSIYMNGGTDLSVMASLLIDTQDPGDMMSRADQALRIGDHMDDQYDQAVQLLKRNQEVQAQAQQAEMVARASLQSIEDQMNGLRRQLADVADKWADHLAGMTNVLDAKQAARNSAAAAQWADYLGRLADLRAPSVTEEDLRSGRLPKGLHATRKNPGVAWFGSGDDRITVLPERVVAAVTYAVSTLGTPYHWRVNRSAEMDCSSLIDRSWNVPSIPRGKRTDARPLVPGGVAGLAERTQLVPTPKMSPGDVVFIADPRRGVNHVGVVLDSDTMLASDAITGAVNAVPIPTSRIWQVGRLSLKPPKDGNYVPKATKRPFQCGADPSGFITMPDGRVLANPSLCPPNPGVFGEGHMRLAAIRVGRCTAALWPAIQIIGGWRPSDPYPDHPSGRATDIMMPEGCSATPANLALGTSIAQFFMKNAARFNVQYIIWQQRIWTSGEPPIPAVQWRGMSDRGSRTANHMDHVHITVNGPNTTPGLPVTVSEPTTGSTDEGGNPHDSSDDTKSDKDSGSGKDTKSDKGSGSGKDSASGTGSGSSKDTQSGKGSGSGSK